MAQKVKVLGINGRVGQAVARAFVNAGWDVKGFGRRNLARIAGVGFVQGDATEPRDVRWAAEGADVVVNALNPKYDKWDKGRYEALTASVIMGLKGSGTTMLFAGNIYNYGADLTELAPDSPQNPTRDKGEIRVRIESMLRMAAERGDFKLAILRAPDFYGPGARETNFDLAILSRIHSGVLYYPGTLSKGHSWAYLPDLGRAFVRLAQVREDFGTYESFHFAGHFVTGEEMIALIKQTLPMDLKVKPLPWGLLRAMGFFMPVMREVAKMQYLWEVPHRLVDPRLDALLGADFATPLQEAVMRTVSSYVDGEERAESRVALA